MHPALRSPRPRRAPLSAAVLVLVAVAAAVVGSPTGASAAATTSTGSGSASRPAWSQQEVVAPADTTPEVTLSHARRSDSLVGEAAAGAVPARPPVYHHDVGFPGTAELSPVDQVTDRAGNWYVMDEALQCIKVYDAARNPIREMFTCGTGGKDATHIKRARGLGFDKTHQKLWIADTTNHRVLKVALNGTVEAVGTAAGAPGGTFLEPGDVTVDPVGNAYVVDDRNRVVKLAPDGTFLAQWGSTGNGTGQMSAPLSIEYADAGQKGPTLYVTDAQNARVVTWSPSGAWKGVLGGPGKGDGQMSRQPRGVAVDARGVVYAADVGGNRIVRFAPNGTALPSLGTGLPYYRKGATDLFYGARGLWVHGSVLAVADMWNFRTLLWDLAGASLGKLGGAPPPRGGHVEPHGVALDAQGNVYVSDYWHQHIEKFNAAGAFVSRWGIGRGSAPGTLNLPGGIDVDDTHGFLYIANREERAVDRWRLSDGTFSKRMVLPVASGGRGWPRDVAVDESANRVYAPDEKGRQVVVFDGATGSVVRTISTAGSPAVAMGPPLSVAVDEAKNLYVADGAKNVIHVYGAEGTWLRDLPVPGTPRGVDVRAGTVWVLSREGYALSTTGTLLFRFATRGGSADGALRSPYVGIEAAPDGDVYVGDSDSGRVKVFRPPAG